MAHGVILPGKWVKPVVESVVLPAHAQTSEIIDPAHTNQNTVIFSDYRLKDCIELITSFAGINVYRWRWNDLARDKFGHSGSAVGVIAQEVAQIFPDTVAHRGVFLAVDYRKLGNIILNRRLS